MDLLPATQVQITGHPFPGAGRLFPVDVGVGLRLSPLVDATTGGRVLSVLEAAADEPAVTVTLDTAEATILAALVGDVRLVPGPSAESGAQGVADLRPCLAGDRLVLVGRGAARDALASHLG